MVPLLVACGGGNDEKPDADADADADAGEVRQAPTARITSHADGDTVTEGQVVLFQGSVSDADTEAEDLSATWYAGDTEICEDR